MLKRWRTRILLFLAVLGPGIITANVDNDPSGIFVYSQAGAKFGYELLWTILPVTLALIGIQEMCARMGVVTGKGLSDLIRGEFGLRITFVMMVLLVVVSFGNVIGEFAGIAGSLELFHMTKYASVPVCALLVWLLAVKGDYKRVEKIFLVGSVFYIAYVATGVLAAPNWHLSILKTVTLPHRSVWRQDGYLFMVISIIGTTIAPWMQFYLQSSVVEKGVRVKDYGASMLDVIVGCFFTDLIAWFIIVACAATLFVHGMGAIQVPSDAAEAMRPLAGDYAFVLFAFGLFNASLFAASILPLSTAYTVCEGLGFESGVDKSYHEAPFFYWLYGVLIAGGALTVMLLPDAQLINFAILSQVLNGVLLPVIIILMLLASMGIMLFVLRSLSVSHPLVDLRLLKDRSLTLGSAGIGLFGLALYGTMAILPIYLQDYMGYEPQTAGLVMAPQGLGSWISMWMAGRLLNRGANPRWMIMAGIFLGATGTWISLSYNLQVSPAWIIWPGVIRGLGLGLVSIPLFTLAFATLSREQTPEGSGIFNLMRNLGGSVGIAIISTIMTEEAQEAWNQMGGHINPFNGALPRYLGAAGLHQGNQAWQVLGQILAQHAAMRGILDAFLFLFWSFLVVMLIALLMKNKS